MLYISFLLYGDTRPAPLRRKLCYILAAPDNQGRRLGRLVALAATERHVEFCKNVWKAVVALSAQGHEPGKGAPLTENSLSPGATDQAAIGSEQ